MYASLEIRHEDAAAEIHFVAKVIVIKCSAMQISQLRYRCQLFYLNHIPIKAYSMTYLTGRIENHSAILRSTHMEDEILEIMEKTIVNWYQYLILL